jgi:hypothetical protein
MSTRNPIGPEIKSWSVGFAYRPAGCRLRPFSLARHSHGGAKGQAVLLICFQCCRTKTGYRVKPSRDRKKRRDACPDCKCHHQRYQSPHHRTDFKCQWL